MRALFLVLLFLPSLASARGKLAGVAAGDENYRRLCEHRYAAFSAQVAERPSPAYEPERRLLARHARFDGVVDNDNAAFIKIARAANLGEPTPAKGFFFSENAVLKELNDKVVGDKDLVTALTNLRKDLENFHLKKDPRFEGVVVASYSDFKTFALAHGDLDPALLRLLEEKVELMNRRYGEYVLKMAEQRGWVEKGSGLAQDPRRWFHSGFGSSLDEAGLAARDSRFIVPADGIPRLRFFRDAKAALLRAGRQADLYGAWVGKRFANVEGMLVDGAPGRRILSAEAIEAMKKAVPRAPTAAGYREAVQDALHARFGVTLSDREADALKNYLALADRFSPPLLLEKRVVIDLGGEVHAVVSADFKGQNARNLEETLRSLSATEGAPLGARVREVRKGEERATASLEAKKARFAAAVAKVRPGLVAEFSGDDGMGLLAKPFSETEKLAFARAWREAGGGPGDLRLTFEEFRFQDTKAVIPPEARSGLVVQAEGVEKALREKMLYVLGRKRLNDTQFLVSLNGVERGSPRIDLLLLNDQAFAAPEIAAVRSILQSLGIQPASVRSARP